MIIEGTLALQISKEIVPDLETANIELFKISDHFFTFGNGN